MFLTSWGRFTRTGAPGQPAPREGPHERWDAGQDGEHVLCNHLLAAVFESKALADGPSPGVLSA